MTVLSQIETSVIDNRERLRVMSNQLLAVAIDMVFLSFWLAMQWAFETYIEQGFTIGNTHRWEFVTFKYAFAMATLLPVLFWVALDIWATFVFVKKRATSI